MGRYQLLNKIAQGGMGEVFRAKATGVGGFQKTVVVKRIHPQLAKFPEFVNMFLNEARLAAQLDHPNIVQIFDMGQEDGAYFIAMELVDGTSLQGLARAARLQGEDLPVAEVLKIASLACDGLAHAHNRLDERGQRLNLVHRDISPDNILLSRSGAVKVADFGIAKAATVNAETRAGTTKGKVPYLSPEALTGKSVDGRADLFALGVVIFEALTGERPFDGKGDMGMMRAIVHLPPRSLCQLRPDAPRELDQLLARALAKAPGDRFPSAAAMGEALEQFLVRGGRAVTANAIAELVQRLAPAEPVEPPVPGPEMTEAPTNVRVSLPPPVAQAGDGLTEPATAVVATLAPPAEETTRPAAELPVDLHESPTGVSVALQQAPTGASLAAAPPPEERGLDSQARAREQSRRQNPFEAKRQRKGFYIAAVGAVLVGVAVAVAAAWIAARG